MHGELTEDKANNLNDIASELILGSIVSFSGMMTVGRDKMKQTSPSVITVDVPNDVYEWPGVLRRFLPLLRAGFRKGHK